MSSTSLSQFLLVILFLLFLILLLLFFVPVLSCHFLFSPQIQEKLKTEGLHLVGWYHSHPSNEATPTHNDITQQLEYQEKMKLGGSQIPCVALIVGETNIC